MQEPQGTLGGEDPLEEEKATHFSILAGIIPWTEEPGGLKSMELQSQTRLSTRTCARAHTHTHILSHVLRL